MDKVNTLITDLERLSKSSRNDLLSLAESPIEKIFLLYVLNFIENAIMDEFYSRISISGYSYIKNVDFESQFMGDKAIGLQLTSAGTGARVNYPNGIPMSDGTFKEVSNNSLRRKVSTIDSDKNDNFSYIQHLSFYPQYEVQLKEKNYRLDFAFLIYESIEHKSTLVKKIGVECDGYDYHSSPSQFKRDRERGRLLQNNDWTIIRYSGSDINQRLFKNYKKEIEEIFDMMGFGVFNR